MQWYTELTATDRLPYFDLYHSAEALTFQQRLQPRAVSGLTAASAVTLIHLILIFVVLVLFVAYTTYSSVNQKWAAVSRL